MVSWLRVPLLNDLGAYAPATQDAEMPLYVDGGGAITTLKASTPNGGTIAFATAADAGNAVFVALLKAANSGQQCVYRAHYDSQSVLAQGQCTIKDRGSQGGANDIPTWGFEIAGFNVSYYNSISGTLIV